MLEVKITKEVINKLNEVAQVDFEKAKRMLDTLNELFMTEFSWLNKRVVFFEGRFEDYATARDAWAALDEYIK